MLSDCIVLLLTLKHTSWLCTKRVSVLCALKQEACSLNAVSTVKSPLQVKWPLHGCALKQEVCMLNAASTVKSPFQMMYPLQVKYPFQMKYPLHHQIPISNEVPTSSLNTHFK